MVLRDGWLRLFDYVYLGLSPSKHDAPSAMQSCIIDSSIPFLSGLEWARSSGDVLKILEKLVPVLVLSTHSMSAILDAKIAGMIVGSLAQHVPPYFYLKSRKSTLPKYSIKVTTIFPIHSTICNGQCMPKMHNDCLFDRML